MTIKSGRRARAIAGLGLALALAGCVGYVEGDGDVNAAVLVQPDYYPFGWAYRDGGYSRDYGRRGQESRRRPEYARPAPPPPAGIRPAIPRPAAPPDGGGRPPRKGGR